MVGKDEGKGGVMGRHEQRKAERMKDPEFAAAYEAASAELKGGGMSREKELSDALDRDYPESWVPEKAGDKIIGQYVRTDEGPSDYGPVPIYVLSVDGKEFGVWSFHAVLRSQWETARAKPGDTIGIAYKGEKQGARNTYKNYRVINLDRTEPEPGATYAPPEDVEEVKPDSEPEATRSDWDQAEF